MVTNDDFRELARSFDSVEEAPHFEKASFKVNKKIFVTLSEKEQKACLKFSLTDQSVFCAYDHRIIYPVPNKWGLQGWTFIELDKIPEAMLKDALNVAYETAVDKKQKRQKRP